MDRAMFLMFSLKRENVLPTGDFGVRMAMYKHYLDVPRAANKSAAAKKLRKRKIKLPTRTDGEDREALGALSQRRVLVSVAEPRHQDSLVRWERKPLCARAPRVVK